MDKLGGTCIFLLLHHADMGVNTNAFHTSPTGHTSEHHEWVGGIILQWVHIYGASAINVYGAGTVK